MGQTSDPETLVMHQKITPSNNPKDFKQQRVSCLPPSSDLYARGQVPFQDMRMGGPQLPTRTWWQKEILPGIHSLSSTLVAIRFNEQAILSYVQVDEMSRSSLKELYCLKATESMFV
jgi:hypothetical protein